MRLADDARRKDVSNEDKRKADYHYEAARDFPESVRALAQMKRVETATKDAAWVAQCNELNGKLRAFAEQLVNDKDHEGGTKLRSFAENQARPVRKKLNASRSQDGCLSSWLSTAQRFSATREPWHLPAARHHDRLLPRRRCRKTSTLPWSLTRDLDP